MDVANEGRSSGGNGESAPAAAAPKDEKEMDLYSNVFANVEYWKKIGEEYQQPLIVTGTVLFTPHQRNSIVQREEEVYDSFGRRRVVPVRTYMERKGFVLSPKFIFIDGRTGTVMHSQTAREEILYNANQATPALSSYFELMDRVLPSFLSALSSQKVKGTQDPFAVVPAVPSVKLRTLCGRPGGRPVHDASLNLEVPHVYAIVQARGRQLKVTPGAVVEVDGVPAETGSAFTFDQVLLVERAAGDMVAGSPFVANAKVVGVVDGEARGPKLRVFKKKRRKGFRKTRGHRSVFTRVRVTGIEL